MLAHFVRLLCGVHQIPLSFDAGGQPVVFFANHSSHLDFAVIWAALEPKIRDRTRPVAGRDYWLCDPVRRFLAQRVFNAVLIERQRVTVKSNPLRPMLAALDQCTNLIVFPEGTRARNSAVAPFKPGLFHLAKSRPQTVFVPVYLENLNRIMPRGALLPVPLIARVIFGPAIKLVDGEARESFLERARNTILALCND